MKDFVKKLQKDLKGLQDAIKKDSDELLNRVKNYTNKENLTAAGVEIEKLVQQRIKKLEPTINKVVGEIRKNADKAGINLDEIESKVKSNVSKAASQLRNAAEKRGLTKVAAKAADRAKTVAKTAKSKAETARKKAAKVKNPVSKAQTKRKVKSQNTVATSIVTP
jgi:hypothetical protein